MLNSSRAHLAADHIADRRAKCEEEKAWELGRDRQFAKLTVLPKPFPLDEEFPMVFETPRECARLLQGIRGMHPRVLVAIESYKQIGLVKRVVQRLSHQRSVGFLLHLAKDVSAEHTAASASRSSTLHAVRVNASAASAVALDGSRDNATTLTPSFLSCQQQARPIPLVPPKTRAFMPSRRMIRSRVLCLARRAPVRCALAAGWVLVLALHREVT